MTFSRRIHCVFFFFVFSLTIFSWFVPIDVWISKQYFIHGEWDTSQNSIWDSLYQFGPYPALLGVLAALGIFVWSFKSQIWLRWRKVSAFLILVFILGPGIVVNLICKDHWGRPRPREIIEFGGSSLYNRVLFFDPTGTGKSFPCGHCSMGFYFFTFFLICRVIRPKWSNWIFAFAIIYGGLIGWARIRQGGHFLTDVIWAGAIVYGVSLALFHSLGLHRNFWYAPSSQFTGRIPRPLLIGVSVVALLLIGGVAAGTPYHHRRDFDITKEKINENNWSAIDVQLELLGSVQLKLGDAFSIHGEAQGFGFPGSKVHESYKESSPSPNSETILSYKQWTGGLFTELRQPLEVMLPSQFLHAIHLNLIGKGDQRHLLNFESLSRNLICHLNPPPKSGGNLIIKAPKDGTIIVENALNQKLGPSFSFTTNKSQQSGTGSPILKIVLTNSNSENIEWNLSIDR